MIQAKLPGHRTIIAICEQLGRHLLGLLGLDTLIDEELLLLAWAIYTVASGGPD